MLATLDRPLLNDTMVGNFLCVMSKVFHTTAVKFRVVQCPYLRLLGTVVLTDNLIHTVRVTSWPHVIQLLGTLYYIIHNLN